MWLPVLQLLKAEDAYAPRRAMFQSPSLGVSGVREANKMADHINFSSSILLSIHNYINASTVILPQFMYYTYQHIILPEVGHEAIYTTNCQNENNIGAACSSP